MKIVSRYYIITIVFSVAATGTAYLIGASYGSKPAMAPIFFLLLVPVSLFIFLYNLLHRVERNKAREKLLGDKTLSDALISSLPGIICLLDDEGYCLKWNIGLETVTGYTEDELSDMSFSELFDYDNNLNDITDNTNPGEESYEKQLLLFSKNEQKTAYRFTVTKNEFKGDVYFMLTGVEVPGEVKTEEKNNGDELLHEQNLLRTLIDNLPDFIYVKNRQLKNILHNNAHIKLKGPAVDDEKFDEQQFLYFTNKLAEKYNEDDRKVLESNTPQLNIEETIYSDTGEKICLLTTKLPLKDEMNNTIGLLVISRNITESKKAEQEIYSLNNELEIRIKERTRQLEASNKELEAFSYSISHDLRAPLRAISGFAMILKLDYADDMDAEANRLIDTVVLNSERMGQLIDDLLSFSRMGRNTIVWRPVLMKALVEECLHTLIKPELKHFFELQVEDLPDCNGDSSMLKQVWINLLSNAIKYSSQNEKPFIYIGFTEDVFRYIYFVKDKGVGFDMQYSHKLFGVFQRLHSNEEFEGTGVGLALVKRIILKHKGSVWAESVPGEGTTFFFSIPKKYLVK